MRCVNLIVLCTAANLFGSEIACAAGDGAFRISDWVGRAYPSQQEKQFNHCSAQLTNADKITIIYSLDRQYSWSLDLSSPSWNFTKGASFPVTLGLGNRGYIRQRAIATDAQLVRVQLPDNLAVFEALRKILQIDVVAGGLTTKFNLTYGNQVLTALTRCVGRYAASARSRAAIAVWLKSPAGADADSKIQHEAAVLATNIMAEVAIPNAVNLKPDEIPAGVPGDAVWKAGAILFTVSILPQKEMSEIDELTNLIIGGDAQKCRGDFFSGATLDATEAVRIARTFTNCQTPQATTSVYYLAVPRKQGGLYLLAIITSGFEITAAGEKTARDVDGKIRTSLPIALSKEAPVDQ